MESRSLRVFITDCEGPVTKNDNAAELADAFIPEGSRFFAKISLYDDYLAEVARKPGYKAGDTLRLILPFFKAFGLDNDAMIEFSGRNIDMIPQAGQVLRKVLQVSPAYIVSTSYSPYVRAVCSAIDFPCSNTYSTEVNLDSYALAAREEAALKGMHATILDLADFTIPAGATSPSDLSVDARRTVQRLDEIFWTELPKLEINRILLEVNPVGGREKARAIQDIVASHAVGLGDVFYVGDSITDVEAFRLVKSSGGMALSFNGNHWAVTSASFAVTSQTALPVGWLAALFFEKGLEGFKDLTMSEINPENAESIAKFSSRVRKEVRTEKIGSLG